MVRFKKILVYTIILIVLVILGGGFYVNQLKNRGLPDYEKNLALEGLSGEVKVYRDSLGIPHLYAQNMPDMYRATGYLMAQERMWQMDLLRRVTLGRLSELFGEDFVDADLLFRALGFTEKSEMLLDSLRPDLKSYLKAYTAGINQCIADQEGKLPLEFKLLAYKPEKWKMAHTLNLIGYMAWDLSGAWDIETVLHKIRAKVDSTRFSHLLPDMGLHDVRIFSDDDMRAAGLLGDNTLLPAARKVKALGLETLHASNNWAVRGSKTANGKAILANDMHLGLSVPGIWMQIHQVVEGQLDVTGVALPGAPFVISGHNQDIAWGLTNVMLDDIDFYIETVNPDNENQYKLNGEWKPFSQVKERVEVSKGEAVGYIQKFTHRGPVITRYKETDEVISMHWTGNEYSNEIGAVFGLNVAKNWDDFKSAVEGFKAISQNFAYADTKGNIGMYTCAGVPQRKTAGWQVFPGDTTAYDWDSFVPFDSLPHSYNPPGGFVYSANNRIVGDDYPHYISYWYDLPYRAGRIRSVLAAKDNLTVEDFKHLQNDHYAVFAAEFAPQLVQFLEDNKGGLSETGKKGLQLLKNWDYKLKATSAAALVFEKTVNHVLRKTFEDELGEELLEEYFAMDLLSNYVLDRMINGQPSPWADDVRTTGQTETFADMVRLAYTEVMDEILAEMGPEASEWQWGRVHTFTLKHPLSTVKTLDRLFDLNRGPFPVGGSFHTVSPYSFKFYTPFSAAHGASQRHIYPVADWDKAQTVIPTGISGIPGSPYYCNQTQLYINKQYHPDPYTKKAVKAAHKHYMEFVPGN